MTMEMQASSSQADFASLKGRVTIITGAGQGIGKVFAKAFAQCGAIVVIAERNAASAKAVAAEIADANGRGSRGRNRCHAAGVDRADGRGG